MGVVAFTHLPLQFDYERCQTALRKNNIGLCLPPFAAHFFEPGGDHSPEHLLTPRKNFHSFGELFHNVPKCILSRFEPSTRDRCTAAAASGTHCNLVSDAV